MRLLAGALFCIAASCAAAQDQEIQRALIQRDQQSAEFAARLHGSAGAAQLEQLHARQLLEAARPLHPDAGVARALHPYQRSRMAQESALALPAPLVRARAPEPALPLPGGPKPGVDPVPVQGFPH